MQVDRIYSVNEANERFKELDSGFFTRLKNRIVAGAKWFIPGLIAGTAIGGIGGFLYYLENREQPPKLREILSAREYQDFTLNDFVDLSTTEKQNIVYSTSPALEFAKRHLPEVEQSGRFPDVRKMTRKAQKEHKMDPRLVSSWLRSCYLAQDFLSEGYKKEGEKRSGVSFVPSDFAYSTKVIKPPYVSPIKTEDLNHEADISRGVLYLKQCLSRDSAANTFARYFSEAEEIAKARVKSGVIDYFLGEDDNDKDQVSVHPRGGGTGKIRPQRTGYRHSIPEHQRRAIDLASVLYMLTDENGNLDLDKPFIDVEVINHYSQKPEKWD